MRTDLGLEDFTESLRALDAELDAELDARGYQGELEIRALGGFALLAHGLRESGYTADIDTATPDLTPVERAAVLAVAKALDLPPDWLNNDVVMGYDGETTWDDVDALDVMLEADCELLDLPGGLTHVSVSVATLETLAKAKAYACEDIGFGRTPKDADDLMEVCARLGAHELSEARAILPWLSDPEFSAARDVIRARSEGSGKDPRPSSSAVIADLGLAVGEGVHADHPMGDDVPGRHSVR